MNKLNGNPYGPSRSEILERKNEQTEVKELLKEILNKIDQYFEKNTLYIVKLYTTGKFTKIYIILVNFFMLKQS